jgi:hypothetical protein
MLHCYVHMKVMLTLCRDLGSCSHVRGSGASASSVLILNVTATVANAIGNTTATVPTTIGNTTATVPTTVLQAERSRIRRVRLTTSLPSVSNV